jgi:hypothetical protein
MAYNITDRAISRDSLLYIFYVYFLRYEGVAKKCS